MKNEQDFPILNVFFDKVLNNFRKDVINVEYFNNNIESNMQYGLFF